MGKDGICISSSVTNIHKTNELKELQKELLVSYSLASSGTNLPIDDTASGTLKPSKATIYTMWSPFIKDDAAGHA